LYDLKGSKKLLSSTEDISSPRPSQFSKTWKVRGPRTSKIVLEAKDVLKAATSGKLMYSALGVVKREGERRCQPSIRGDAPSY